jgi:hypothetical protein
VHNGTLTFNKEFFETNNPRGRAIEVFRWFHFDLKKVKNQNSVFCPSRNLEKQFLPPQREGESGDPEA